MHLHLPPAREWTAEEDAIILHLVSEIGLRWTKIAEALDGRSDSAVRNRYHRLTAPAEPKPARDRSTELPWTPEEDSKLQQGYAKHGTKWLSIIKEFLPERSRNAIRNRFGRRTAAAAAAPSASAAPSTSAFSSGGSSAADRAPFRAPSFGFTPEALTAATCVAFPPLVATGGPMGGVRLPTPTEAAQQAAEAYAHSQARSHAHAQLPTMDAHAQLHAPHVQAAQAAAVTLQQMLQLRQAPSHLMNAHEAVMLAALQVSTPEYP